MIVAELKFGQVERQVLLGNVAIGADDSTLEQRPEAFDAVGMNFAPRVLALTVAHGFMREGWFQDAISGMFIGCDQGHEVADGFAHEPIQRRRVGVLDNLADDVALAADCANDANL
jgi:hypothetical protein